MKFELNKVYKARNGTEWKIVCSLGVGRGLNAINNKQDRILLFSYDGTCCALDSFGEYDLIELVGDDFTDNLRCYSFNGILIELIEDLHRIRNHDFVKNKMSKWELTMKELPND